MSVRILLVGGAGRIGQAVVRDLYAHTPAQLCLAGRDRTRGEAVAATLGRRGDFVSLDLDHTPSATRNDIAAVLGDAVDQERIEDARDQDL